MLTYKYKVKCIENQFFKGEDFYHTFIYNSKEDAEKQGETFYNYVTTIKIEWEE